MTLVTDKRNKAVNRRVQCTSMKYIFAKSKDHPKGHGGKLNTAPVWRQN